VYLTIDFKILKGYPIFFDTKWSSNPPRFEGGLPIPHIVEFFKYMSKIELGGEDVLVKLFILSLPSFLKYWFKDCCEDRHISSFVHLIMYEVSLQNFTIALKDKGITTEIVEDHRDVYHAQYQETFDIKEEIYEGNLQPLEEE
jgi:hypothetical protein